MKRIVVCLVLAVALTGCGGSSPVATERSLLNAIPEATELPPGWADSGIDPETDLEPLTGDGFGFCGGPNAHQRAMTANVTATASKSGWQTNITGEYGTLYLYAFENEDDAAAFMASTKSAVSSCSSEEITVPEFVEGRDDDTTDYRKDIFAKEFEPDEPWKQFTTTSLGAADAEGADEAFFIKKTSVFNSQAGNKSYGITSGSAFQYERHGTVVVVITLFGECCLFGFGNTDSRDEGELPQYSSLQDAADRLRPVILAEVFNNADT